MAFRNSVSIVDIDQLTRISTTVLCAFVKYVIMFCLISLRFRYSMYKLLLVSEYRYAIVVN